MPNWPDGVLPLVAGLGGGVPLLLFLFIVVASDAGAKNRQLAEAMRLLAQRQARLQRMSARLRQLVQQVEGLAGAAAGPAGRLRLSQDGTLREDDGGPAV